ncbi:LysM peptidoglycan-binding domain-containing protein [Kocuria flava]|uniref:CIS tube protein n=1 Tax=Kocuria flava TaxID=446860 RepID=UPI001FF48D9C|nr:LysM peptidoglycan-binding domain-containing protein [Kocuria flava]MCJ8505889.1 LysM peptidoglycan-binding domain-containing protein [Kocuria flava]
MSSSRSSVSNTSTGGSAGGRTPAATLVHAQLEVFEPSADGALDKPGAPIDTIEFQFNPKELTLEKSAAWQKQTAKGNRMSGPPQYKGPNPSKLTLEMFFDASVARDDSVVKRVDQLFTCCIPTQESHQQKKESPPWILFRWGTVTGFLAYISNVQAKYTLFTADGLPVRATCTVTLEQLAGEPPGQNPTSGGLVPRRSHVVVEGDTLAGIAYAEYGNPSLWRAVAELNRLDDPMRLRPGSTVLLPTTDEMLRPRRTGTDTGGVDRGLR